MISKTDLRILLSMIEKCNRLIELCKEYSDAEIENNYIYSDAVQFEFEKLYEDSTRLSGELRINHQDLHIYDLRAIRNRVAHDYESVSLRILLDTVRNDIPQLKETIDNFLKNNKTI